MLDTKFFLSLPSIPNISLSLNWIILIVFVKPLSSFIACWTISTRFWCFVIQLFSRSSIFFFESSVSNMYHLINHGTLHSRIWNHSAISAFVTLCWSLSLAIWSKLSTNLRESGQVVALIYSVKWIFTISSTSGSSCESTQVPFAIAYCFISSFDTKIGCKPLSQGLTWGH